MAQQWTSPTITETKSKLNYKIALFYCLPTSCHLTTTRASTTAERGAMINLQLRKLGELLDNRQNPFLFLPG
jgi:hypothetical protein